MRNLLFSLITIVIFTAGAQSVVADQGVLLYDDWVEASHEPIEVSMGGVFESPCDFDIYVDYRYYEMMKGNRNLEIIMAREGLEMEI